MRERRRCQTATSDALAPARRRAVAVAFRRELRPSTDCCGCGRPPRARSPGRRRSTAPRENPNTGAEISASRRRIGLLRRPRWPSSPTGDVTSCLLRPATATSSPFGGRYLGWFAPLVSPLTGAAGRGRGRSRTRVAEERPAWTATHETSSTRRASVGSDPELSPTMATRNKVHYLTFSPRTLQDCIFFPVLVRSGLRLVANYVA